MASAEWVIHNGKRIFLLDVSEVKDNKESFVLSDRAVEMIKIQPPKSVLLCTDFTNVRYDSESTEKLKYFSKEVTPYVKARAVVGIVGLKLIILNSIKAFTGQDIKPFKTRQEAYDYLVSLN